jgi:hypothetical protein
MLLIVHLILGFRIIREIDYYREDPMIQRLLLSYAFSSPGCTEHSPAVVAASVAISYGNTGIQGTVYLFRLIHILSPESKYIYCPRKAHSYFKEQEPDLAWF